MHIIPLILFQTKKFLFVSIVNFRGQILCGSIFTYEHEIWKPEE